MNNLLPGAAVKTPQGTGVVTWSFPAHHRYRRQASYSVTLDRHPRAGAKHGPATVFYAWEVRLG